MRISLEQIRTPTAAGAALRWPVVRDLVDEYFAVDDAATTTAMRLLFERSAGARAAREPQSCERNVVPKTSVCFAIDN